MIGLDSYSRQDFIYLDPILIYISLWIDCLFEIRKIAVFPLAFIAGWLQGHWCGFISRNYVVWPTFLLMNVFIALKGSHFWFLLYQRIKIRPRHENTCLCSCETSQPVRLKLACSGPEASRSIWIYRFCNLQLLYWHYTVCPVNIVMMRLGWSWWHVNCTGGVGDYPDAGSLVYAGGSYIETIGQYRI